MTLNKPSQADHHGSAVVNPKPGAERALVRMIEGWVEYRTGYAADIGSKVGEDYVLGLEWESIGKSILGLLNGPTGNRLNRGVIDGFIRMHLEEEGYDPE